MPLHLGWPEIALRLGLAFVSALLVGLNRERRREAAGLRTNLLVCLAAAVSMIQVNLLLETSGKNAASFSVLDLMRLPLGILTGMGFIGAGAILKRGNMVLGVTTAASLWFTTVMGLCFGGGQLGLGLVSLGLALFVLMALKWLETHQQREHRALLCVVAEAEGLTQDRIEAMIRQGGAEPVACSLAQWSNERLRRYEFVIGWKAREETPHSPDFVEKLGREATVRELKWLPDTVSSSRDENAPRE